MSFHYDIFGSGSIDFDRVGWKNLRSIEELEAVIARSYELPVVIFKHSTRCGISSAAQDRLHRGWDIPDHEAEFYHLDLIRHRDVSNKIAELLAVVHHSPQVILLKEGKAVYHTSHHMISVDGVKMAL